MLADLKHLIGLITTAVGLAFLINHLRADSLGMAYATPAQQIGALQKERAMDSHAFPITVVGIDQVIQAVKSRTYLIVDARPALFWELGHIPGAINLPRKEFANHFLKIEPLLREAVGAGRPLLLYCADFHCPDAGALAGELNRRGFDGILLFEAGWAEWENAGQPGESK